MAACERFRADLDRYMDGEIDREGREVLERHLAGCASCSRALQELRGSRALLREWSAALTAPARPAAFRSGLLTVRLAMAAAAGLLLAGLLAADRSGRRDPGGGHAAIKPGHELHWHSLADGVKVVPGRAGEPEELIVEAFPLKFRSMSSGVEVVAGKSGEPAELVVDPFPEEGR